jgi:hypothetical protein
MKVWSLVTTESYYMDPQTRFSDHIEEKDSTLSESVEILIV